MILYLSVKCKLGNGGIQFDLNYSVINETKWNE
jgi:hypothetical protein